MWIINGIHNQKVVGCATNRRTTETTNLSRHVHLKRECMYSSTFLRGGAASAERICTGTVLLYPVYNCKSALGPDRSCPGRIIQVKSGIASSWAPPQALPLALAGTSSAMPHTRFKGTARSAHVTYNIIFKYIWFIYEYNIIYEYIIFIQ